MNAALIGQLDPLIELHTSVKDNTREIGLYRRIRRQ